MRTVCVVIITIIMMSKMSEGRNKCKPKLANCKKDLADMQKESAKKLDSCNKELMKLRKEADQCSSNPSCDVKAICTNVKASHKCTCKSGFYGDGKTCSAKAGEFAASAIMSSNNAYQSQLGKFLAPAVGQNPQWKLCYRASSDGWAATTFHQRCDGKPNTVTIVKVGEYVFGGYTDIIPWDTSDTYGSTSKAFIFSLHDKEGLAPFKSMVKDPTFAVYRHSTYGPMFGIGDIYISSDAYLGGHRSYANFGTSYSLPSGIKDPRTILAGTFNFTPDDWEVLYLA